MSYVDVRGPDGHLLFRYDPDRLVVEVRRQGVAYVIDLMQYAPQERPAVVETDPMSVAGNGRQTANVWT